MCTMCVKACEDDAIHGRKCSADGLFQMYNCGKCAASAPTGTYVVDGEAAHETTRLADA